MSEQWLVQAQTNDDAWWTVGSLDWASPLHTREEAVAAARHWSWKYSCVTRIHHYPSGAVESVVE